jgi:membrane associated rhomboid family serine protease
MVANILFYGIIITTVLVSYVCFQNRDAMFRLHFSPDRINRHSEYYRFITYGFVHADWAHLIINMFVLYSFGSFVIDFSGQVFRYPLLFFSGLYFGAIIMSTIFSFFKHRNNYAYASVGASGAVSAIVFTSILFYPFGSIRMFLIPIDIPAWVFGFLYLIYSAVMAKRGKDNIGHDAHFFGALYGLAFPVILEPRLLDYFISFF